MRISELARRGGLPVATVKYYLREGLLPAGEPTAATQAQYGESHVERLLLIRALLGTGGLSVLATRAVLAVVDDPTTSVHEALGAAHCALPPTDTDPPPDELSKARDHLRRWGWQTDDASPSLAVLAAALHALKTAHFDTPDELLDRYADAAATLAEDDVASVPTGSATEAIRFVVVGTVLLEPVLLALRRLAQENFSARRLARDEFPRRDPEASSPAQRNARRAGMRGAQRPRPS
jgi:DNA-binding transcriptional MerR regulator